MQRNRPRAAVAFAALLLASVVLTREASAQPAPPAPPAPPAQPAPAEPNKWPENPATAADPPLLPPPSGTPTAPRVPTSTSGTDVAPPGDAPPPAPIIVDTNAAANKAAGDEARAKIRELEARMGLDEARIKTLENDLGPLRHLTFQGYVQFQYRVQSVNAAASPNLMNGSLPPGITSNDVIAKADGTTTNTNLFRLRRTRLRAIYETDVLRVFLQIDLLPSGGPTATQGTIARNAEATGIANWSKNVKTEFTGGLFMVPFLAETFEASMYRPFVERTHASQNMFPNERDLGVHAKTFVMNELFTFDFGVLNGQRLGESRFVLQPDLNASKDFFAMATSKHGPANFHLSGYAGRGQVVDAELLRVKNYARNAVNLGVTIVHPIVPSLGDTKVVSELMFGSNMDTGVMYPFALPAIPAGFSDDVKNRHQQAFYVRAEQELTKWGLAGFRYEKYTADSTVKNNARDTYTLMAGLRFTKLLRLINEASVAIDNIHPEGSSAPSRHIYGWTTWMQGSFY